MVSLLIMSSEFPPRVGGIGTYSFEMATAASTAGYDVTVLAADYGSDQSSRDKDLPFEVIRFPGGPHTAKQAFSKLLLVQRLSAKRQFDIVHAADWPFYIPMALSKYRSRSRCVATFHGTEVRFMQRPKRKVLLRLLRFWSGWVEYIANSRHTASRLQQAFPDTKGRVRPVGLGVSEIWAQAYRPKQDARVQCQLPGSRFVIVTLGRLVPRKGHLFLLEAISQLPDDDRRTVTWLVIGPAVDRHYRAELQQAIAQQDIDVRCLGPLQLDDVQTFVSASDVMCLPAYEDADGAVEGFGLALLEAAALGVPAIATRSGGIPDAVLDGKTGILVPERNVEALAAALYQSVANRDRLAGMAASAREHALKSTWISVVNASYN